MIVVDTSVLIDLFRGSPSPGAQRLREIERSGTPFEIPAICVQEVLQGAGNEREYSRLEAVLATQRVLATSHPLDVHRRAARIYFDCRRRGLTIRSSVDCWIAAQVIEREGILLHQDADFERMRQVCSLDTLA